MAGVTSENTTSENATSDTSTSERVIIVGGGIVGISCAHYLTRAGYQVTVIDRNRIAAECSHGNCGYICPSHVLPLTEPGAFKVALKSLFNPRAPFRVRPSFDPALWKWMWQFAKRCRHSTMLAAGVHLKAILDSSLTEYQQLIADEKLQCEWKEDGLLYVLRTEHGMREFAATDQLLTEHFDVRATRIEGNDLTDFDPALKPGLAGAFHYPGDASVRPDLLNAAWSRLLRERGVTFIEECELTNVVRADQNVVKLETSKGPMTAERYVFATGALSTRLSEKLECSIPIQPGKGYSVTMERPEICPKYPMLFPEHKVGVSPFDSGYRLGSMMEFCGYDSSIPARRIQQLRDSAKPYLQMPYTENVTETWYGWRPMTWDSLPIIGRLPRLSNAMIAAGHNMLGLSLATATGRLVAEIMRDETPHIDVSAFSPARFQ